VGPLPPQQPRLYTLWLTCGCTGADAGKLGLRHPCRVCSKSHAGTANRGVAVLAIPQPHCLAAARFRPCACKPLPYGSRAARRCPPFSRSPLALSPPQALKALTRPDSIWVGKVGIAVKDAAPVLLLNGQLWCQNGAGKVLGKHV